MTTTKIEKCSSCGKYHEILRYSPRCHPGAPLFLELYTEDQVLVATCARCGQPAGAWTIKPDTEPQVHEPKVQ